jgi:hypothetical protein
MARAQAGETFCIAPLDLLATALVAAAAETEAEDETEEGARLIAVEMAVATEDEARLSMEEVVGTAE